MQGVSADVIDQLMTVATSYGLDALGAIVILVLGWIAAGWAGRATTRMLGRSKRIDLTLQRFFSSLVRYAVIVFAVLATLQQFGIQTTSLLAVLGAAGLAIGLALQGTLSNVAAGVMLLIFRPFRVDDVIEAGSVAGTVVYLGLFTTELRTADGIFIVVPNSELWGSSLKNFSRNPTRRIQIVLGIDYGDSIETAMQMINSVIENEPRRLADPEPQVVVGELADSSINIYVRVWVNTSDYWNVYFDMLRTLKESADAAGLTIPFPQQTVHIEKADAA